MERGRKAGEVMEIRKSRHGAEKVNGENAVLLLPKEPKLMGT